MSSVHPGSSAAGVSPGPQIAEPKKRKDNTHWLYIGVIIAVIGGIALGSHCP